MPDTATPRSYPYRITEKLRYCDTDRQGHVNNAIFSTFCESGRVPFLYDPSRGLPPPGSQFVIAQLTLNFIEEINWPGEVEIGTGVARIGRSSLTLNQSIFFEGRVVGTADSVIVLMDEATRKSTPLPDEARKTFEALMVTAATEDS